MFLPDSHMRNYIRKFKSWMNYSPPGALSSKNWRLFNDEFKKNAPIRYWFKNDFRKTFVLPIKWKYENIENWIYYRLRKCHIVDSGLEPGYYDIDTLILNTNFNMLKDFVECQLASREYWMDSDLKKTWCERNMPLYWYVFKFRNPRLGIKNLAWQATLDDPALPPHEQSVEQAVNAREIMFLYNWWVNVRPNRKLLECGEYSDQGLGFMAIFDDDFDKDAPDYKAYKEIVDKNHKLEAEWDKEDDDMLVRLVNIRRSLWA